MAIDYPQSDPNSSDAAARTEEQTVGRSAGRRPRSALLVAVVAAVFASLLSWGSGETFVAAFKPKRAGDPANPMAVQFDRADLDRSSVKNAALAWAVQGGILSAALGLAGALARRSARAAAPAMLAGLLLGAALGGAAAFGVFTAYFRMLDGNETDLIPSVMAHAGAWAAAGVAAGLAFGIGLGGRDRIARSLIGGVVGAAVGAMLYDVAGSIAFPLGKTSDPVAASAAARLLAHGVSGLAIAAGAALFAESGSRPPKR
jgi:hypothetical protein